MKNTKHHIYTGRLNADSPFAWSLSKDDPTAGYSSRMLRRAKQRRSAKLAKKKSK